MLAQVRTMACCMNYHPWDIGEVLVYVRRKVSITDSLVWVLQEAVSVLAQLQLMGPAEDTSWSSLSSTDVDRGCILHSCPQPYSTLEPCTQVRNLSQSLKSNDRSVKEVLMGILSQNRVSWTSRNWWPQISLCTVFPSHHHHLQIWGVQNCRSSAGASSQCSLPACFYLVTSVTLCSLQLALDAFFFVHSLQQSVLIYSIKLSCLFLHLAVILIKDRDHFNMVPGYSRYLRITDD